MDENVQKTIADIHKIIQNWKKFWLAQYSTDGVNAWILNEFTELILGGGYYQYGMVSSAIDGLVKGGFITKLEYESFWEKTFGEIDDMRRLLGLPDPKESPVEGDK